MKELKISVWGDSLMQGVLFDCDNDKYYLNGGIVPKIAKELKFEIKNFSRFGMNTDKAAKLFNKNAANDTADIILIEYGGNDCNYDWEKVSNNPDLEHTPFVPLQQFTENIELMINTAISYGKRVILTTLPPIDSQKFFNFITRKGLNKENILRFLGDKEHIYRHHERYNTALIKLSKKYDLLLTDIRDSFLQQKTCDNLICFDGMHPTVLGQDLMFGAFIDFYHNATNLKLIDPIN